MSNRNRVPCLGWKQAVVLKERYKEIQLGTYNQIQGPISTRWLKIQKLDQGFDEKMAEKIMKNAEAARFPDPTTVQMGHSLQYYGSIKIKMSGPRRIWSQTYLTPDFWSPGQMVPNQFGPCICRAPHPVPLDKQNILGTISM